MIDQLINYWFSEKEAKLYLLSISMWSQPISVLAKRIGLHRVTTYSIMKWLIQRWYAVQYTNKSTTYYQCISAEELLLKLKLKYDSFFDVVPAMMALSAKDDDKPQIKFFEWYDGLKTLYNDMLNSKKIYTFIWTNHIEKTFKAYLDNEFIPS